MEGALLVVKPPGMTSHDVVDFFRRLTGIKAGHTGTLDTAAAGLLVLCVGRATRLAQHLVGCDKTYWAEASFGLGTDSGDAEGRIVARGSAEGLTEAAVAATMGRLTGRLSLQVPRYSAIKSGGQPLHRKARRGEAVEAPERQMRVHRWELREFRPGPAAVARTEMDCASGTYVRSLVQALAEAVGVPAYLLFLVRTRVGHLHLAEAWSLEEIEQAQAAGSLQDLILPPAEVLAHLPAVTLDEEEELRVRHGRAVALGPAEAGASPLRLLDARGALLAVGRVEEAQGEWLAWPETVLASAD